MRNVAMLLAFLLVFAVGGVLLQIFLARQESKWPGLVLPLLTFLYALLMACSAVAYNGGFPWGAVLASLVLGNLPTAVLLAIYCSCREKRKRRDDVEKMNIQDL